MTEQPERVFSSGHWWQWNGTEFILEPPPPFETDSGETAVPGHAAPTAPLTGWPAFGAMIKRHPCVIATVVVLVFIVGSFIFFPSKPGTGGSGYDESGAWQNCQAQESKQLKAPATAGYPLLSELKWSKSGSTWTFPAAWVDAQNGFGAQIRTHFSCTVTDVGGGQVDVVVDQG